MSSYKAYENLGKLGKGSYGAVTKNRHILTGDVVAIKCFLADDKDYAVVKKSVLVEVSALRDVCHDNVVKLFHVFMENSVFYMVFEYVSKTLLDVIHEAPKKCLGAGPRTKSFLFQLLRAVSYIHSRNYLHRDVKPENVLITKDDILRVADFGFATKHAYNGQRYSSYIATRWYRAPELLTGDYCYGKAVDVWAIGAVAVEMIKGQPMAAGTEDADQMVKTLQIVGRIPKYMWERATKMYSNCADQTNDGAPFTGLDTLLCQHPGRLTELIKLCLEPDPLIRHPADHLLSHSYFTEDDKYFIAHLLTEIKQSSIENSHSSAAYQHFLQKRTVFQRAAREFLQLGSYGVASIISRYRQLGLDQHILKTLAEMVMRDNQMIPDFRGGSSDMYTVKSNEQGDESLRATGSYRSSHSLFPSFQFRSGSMGNVTGRPLGYASTTGGWSAPKVTKAGSCLVNTKNAPVNPESPGKSVHFWPDSAHTKNAVSVIRGEPSSLQQAIRSKPAFIARKPTSTVSEVVHAAIDNNKHGSRSTVSGNSGWYKSLAPSTWKTWHNRGKHSATTSAGQDGDSSKHFRSDTEPGQRWTFEDEPLDLSVKKGNKNDTEKPFDLFEDTNLLQPGSKGLPLPVPGSSASGPKWDLDTESDDEVQNVYSKHFLPTFYNWSWQYQN